MLHKIMLAGSVVVGLVGAVQAENYVCIAEQTTGFIFMDGRWTSTSFQAGERWLASVADVVEIKKFGGGISRFFGSECFVYGQSVSCRYSGGEFNLDTKTMRYLSTYTIGYVEGYDNSGNTPVITIGTCAKM